MRIGIFTDETAKPAGIDPFIHEPARRSPIGPDSIAAPVSDPACLPKLMVTMSDRPIAMTTYEHEGSAIVPASSSSGVSPEIALAIGGTLCACAAFLLSGCANFPRHGLDPARAQQIEKAASPVRTLDRNLEQRILALNPEHVTEQNIHELLSQAPAPRIINIHGGRYPVHLHMISFSHFLMGMGYPGRSITNPGDGTYSFSCYESSDKIAGVIAWYYEREGLRPMIIGHSQGGMQAIKVLHKLSGETADKLAVWNPLTWQPEDRCEITDPLTGKIRPVVGLRLSYVSSAGAGGMTRLLPNQWDTTFNLRQVPDSVVEFTGFYKHFDHFGGDWLGYGSANHSEATGTAIVRNVRLPTAYRHGPLPETEHLLKSQQIKDWINNYRPPDKFVDAPELTVHFDSDSKNILWAADVWYSIKKHWVLELQRFIRAKRGLPYDE